ncbi:hypothetical protein O181_015389 [Austropuccinia psidii MF-1]|uniref:Hpc2-related domain-containing protein n=1 Tax=Austropuccinia psidii MF-1 TaxID=1389203 RepID=A0A9Q3GQT2_9BASI|nr:hypothetical protein [Austropuccinia psidii MF-1]
MSVTRLMLKLSTQFPITTTERNFLVLAKQAHCNLTENVNTQSNHSSFSDNDHHLALEDSLNQSASNSPPPPKRPRSRKPQQRDQGYDKNDPFVDDSEALTMEPKFYYPPARPGFFMANGPIELKRNLNAPRSRKTVTKPIKKATSLPSSIKNPNSAQSNPPKQQTLPISSLVSSSIPLIHPRSNNPSIQSIASTSEKTVNAQNITPAGQSFVNSLKPNKLIETPLETIPKHNLQPQPTSHQLADCQLIDISYIPKPTHHQTCRSSNNTLLIGADSGTPSNPISLID